MHSTRFQTFLFTGKSSIIDQVLKNARSILQDTVEYTYSKSLQVGQLPVGCTVALSTRTAWGHQFLNIYLESEEDNFNVVGNQIHRE